MDFDSYGMGFGFLVVGKVGIKLWCIFVEWFEELVVDKVFVEVINDVVMYWVLGLLKLLMKEIIFGLFVDLNLVFEDYVIFENQQKVCVVKGLLWFEIESGNFFFIGMEVFVFEEESVLFEMMYYMMLIKVDVIFEMIEQGVLLLSGGLSGVFFLLLVDMWVEVLNDGDYEMQFKVYVGDGIIGISGVWEGFKIFYEVFCQCEFINKKLQMVDEFNCLKLKVEYVVVVCKGVIKDFVVVMIEQEEDIVVDVEDVDDDVYEVVWFVCDVSFIMVKCYFEMRLDGINFDCFVVVVKVLCFCMCEVVF